MSCVEAETVPIKTIKQYVDEEEENGNKKKRNNNKNNINNKQQEEVSKPIRNWIYQKHGEQKIVAEQACPYCLV